MVFVTTEGSSTNTGQAFKSCQELLAPSVVIGPDSQKVIIMLTDGNPSAYLNRPEDCLYGEAETEPAPPTAILTDDYRRRTGATGTENSRKCADKWALSARNQGTRVISIGIGPNIDDTALCSA